MKLCMETFCAGPGDAGDDMAGAVAEAEAPTEAAETWSCLRCNKTFQVGDGMKRQASGYQSAYAKQNGFAKNEKKVSE